MLVRIGANHALISTVAQLSFYPLIMAAKSHFIHHLLLLTLAWICKYSDAFVVNLPHHNLAARVRTFHPTVRWMSDSDMTGDPLRAATGIRPSLHPTTINAIAEALKLRAANIPDTPLVVSDDVESLDVALSAGKIAATAIEKRQRSSEKDGMELTPEEGQTIAGRVVGVVMRFAELEELLHDKVSSVDWVKKYGEWTTFGVLEDESEVQDRIKTDPLFTMSRAECLLALFLDTVEAPQMAKIGQSVPGGSRIDFLDSDRQEVLLTFQ